MINQQNEPQKKQLLIVLQDEIKITQNLFESLELEADALIASDMPALEKITAEKSALLHQLESIGQQRESLRAVINENLLFENEPFASLWQALLSLAEKCQEKNLINGSIIKVGFKQSQQALDILRGTSSKPELYDHSGQTTQSANSNSLAQA